MEKYFPKKSTATSHTDLENLPSDPAYRKKILEYHPNERDEFDLYADWLEYSVKKGKAYCLFCYLFGDYTENKGGSDEFVTKGFDTWKNPKRLSDHVGSVNSFHNNALKMADNLMRQGHDESVESANMGNFIELVKYTAEQNELVSKVVLENAPKNNQMVFHKIQTDIVHYFREEVIESVIQEVHHDVFCSLVDESADVSTKEQVTVVFLFVDKDGIVKEIFISVIYVPETSSATLKCAIDSLFAKRGLRMKKLRGQGYDGASNMKGEFNGLRYLTLRENSSAYYVHCFAHQLQLVVVAVAKKHFEVGDFFDMISVLLNVVGASCKRKYMVREDQRKIIEEGISRGEIKTGKGLNQELSFQRPMLEYVESEGTDGIKRRQANGLLKYFHTFDFVFYLQLMLLLLGLTNSLLVAPQRKDQDILNAMSLVKSTKQQLYNLRENRWNSVFEKVNSFCENNKTELIIMEEEFVDPKKPRRRSNITNLHHYQVECSYSDWICKFKSLMIVLTR
ncbi:hypothetical protein CARUB_v10011287mg [Capsella rubella]|uniref:TTF-type domain-containing protein n=1 Tax=Capsella rubella TaxID=81985 RepID=R0IGC2_9BRAS|nr:hypothetical protein CARUB_v10011287mg [Capsella rubella]